MIKQLTNCAELITAFSKLSKDSPTFTFFILICDTLGGHGISYFLLYNCIFQVSHRD